MDASFINGFLQFLQFLWNNIAIVILGLLCTILLIVAWSGRRASQQAQIMQVPAPATPDPQQTLPRKKAGWNLNMAISQVHAVATQLVGIQLSSANLLAIAVSALSVVAGTVLLAVKQYPSAFLIWLFAGLIGIGLAFLIEGLTLGALIRIRLSNKAIKEIEDKIEPEREKEIRQVSRPAPDADYKRYTQALKTYRLTIKEIDQDYKRRLRSATRLHRRTRKSSIPLAFGGALASACAGGLFYHAILSGLDPYQDYGLSALFALVVTGTFVSSELFKDIQEQAIREGFEGQLAETAIEKETRRLLTDVVHEQVAAYVASPEAREDLKEDTRAMLKDVMGEVRGALRKKSVSSVVEIQEDATPLLLSVATGDMPERQATRQSDTEPFVATLVGDTATENVARQIDVLPVATSDTTRQSDTEPVVATGNRATRHDTTLDTAPVSLGMVEQMMLDAIQKAPAEEQAKLRVLAATQTLAECTRTLQQLYPTYAGYITEARVARVMAALQVAIVVSDTDASQQPEILEMSSETPDKLTWTLQFFEDHPEYVMSNAPEVEIELAERLNLTRPASARFWKLKALEILRATGQYDKLTRHLSRQIDAPSVATDDATSTARHDTATENVARQIDPTGDKVTRHQQRDTAPLNATRQGDAQASSDTAHQPVATRQRDTTAQRTIEYATQHPNAKPSEIAEVLGISVRTVQRHLEKYTEPRQPVLKIVH
jgi:hypothetical protein